MCCEVAFKGVEDVFGEGGCVMRHIENIVGTVECIEHENCSRAQLQHVDDE
jgi:hypothetical protein